MGSDDKGASRPGRPPGRQGADLLAVAREVFVEFGFNRATMQEVATRAGISKSSLYREHDSKDALFAAVVEDWATHGRDAMRPHLDQLLAARDLRTALVDFASTLQLAVLEPDVVKVRRLVAAEADRCPETAATYLAESWTRNITALAATISELARRGTVHAPDPWVAAHQFTWTAVGAALNVQTITGSAATMSRNELHRLAIAASDALTTGPNRTRQ